ncbi:cupin [Candidatus Woesebacteria bacterium RIFCSPHIGHO2_01_FULL_38_10]|uniref:Cupin n=1 Tax=Candidatus Woesebacteria bacterium RIFCSPLOWO2_01_FULL_39_10b TaxID=1802517 RepID=A0A1F8B9P3_9BACT|nr:MAG: cupin [Candidatus Woesebacteria bacterium RIFCSPHIGHO2_01_FULL_38_10]OGM60753.1 MAG: cupin [Candidatus Woesebacteria bacterium RIFCSPLOWO2_01_FULL_39_10b]
MKGYIDGIEKTTLGNSNFRKVLFTGKYLQLVVMSLKPGEEIGAEVHPNVDQFFRIEAGLAKVIIDKEVSEAGDGFAIIVPAGSEHNIINTSADKELKLYTIYSPPNHPDKTVHKTREEAVKGEEQEY